MVHGILKKINFRGSLGSHTISKGRSGFGIEIPLCHFSVGPTAPAAD